MCLDKCQAGDNSTDKPIYLWPSYGLYSCGLFYCMHDSYSYGLYSYGLYSYGLYSYGRLVTTPPTGSGKPCARPSEQSSICNAQVYLTHVYTHVHAHAYAHVYTHVCTHVYTHVYTHVCTHRSASPAPLCLCTLCLCCTQLLSRHHYLWLGHRPCRQQAQQHQRALAPRQAGLCHTHTHARTNASAHTQLTHTKKGSTHAAHAQRFGELTAFGIDHSLTLEPYHHLAQPVSDSLTDSAVNADSNSTPYHLAIGDAESTADPFPNQPAKHASTDHHSAVG